MSEPKETEPGESAPEATSEADAPKPVEKKKKKRDAGEGEGEGEGIRDRNERVRAEAAEKRRTRREREQAAATPRRNLDTNEMVEDALARSTHAAAGFLKSHFNKLQWLIMGGLAIWIGYEVYSWRQARQAEKTTATLFSALAAENGKVGAGTEPTDADPSSGMNDTRRSFKSDEERLSTARKEYLLASTSVEKVSAVLADLGAAGVAYDLGQYKDAQVAFEKVKQHPAFGSDNDIRGRTLEGLGMTFEALKNDDAALKQFRELGSMDTANFAALGMYHQARLLKAQGKNEDALKLLDKAGEKLVRLKDTPAAIKYLRMSVLELIEVLDAKKARELQQKLMPTDILKQLQDQLGAANAAKAGLPGGVLPMPALPAEPVEEAPAEPAEPGPAPGPLRDPAPPQDAPPQGAPPPAPPGPP